MEPADDVVIDPRPQPQPPGDDAASEDGGVPARILVVDDVPEVREVTRIALEAAGHAVVEAADGSEALEAVERCRGDVDLLLTDVAMPGMDGPTLARRVRQQLPHTPILFVSANHAFQPPSGPRGVLGLFLPKPYRPSQLVRAVEDALGRGRAQVA